MPTGDRRQGILGWLRWGFWRERSVVSPGGAGCGVDGLISEVGRLERELGSARIDLRIHRAWAAAEIGLNRREITGLRDERDRYRERMERAEHELARARLALRGGVEHLEHSTPEGRAAYEAAPGGELVENAQKWKAYDLLQSQHTSILRRKREVSVMLGGLPPHIAVNRSWSPTYAAMKAVEWHEKQDREAESLRSKLLRMVGLEP